MPESSIANIQKVKSFGILCYYVLLVTTTTSKTRLSKKNYLQKYQSAKQNSLNQQGNQRKSASHLTNF